MNKSMDSDQSTPMNEHCKNIEINHIPNILKVEDSNKISNINVPTASEWKGIQNVTVKQEPICEEQNEKEHQPAPSQDQPKIKRKRLDEDIVESSTQKNFISIKNEIQGIEIEHSSIKKECEIIYEISDDETIKETDGKEHCCLKYWAPTFCHLCQTNIDTTIDDHNQKFHKKGIFFQCPYCDSLQLARNRLRNELKKHRKILSIKCHYCEETYHNWIKIIAHIDEKHPDKVTTQCNICSYEATSFQTLINHKLCCHKGESLITNCKFCNFSTVRYSLLKIHMEVKHKGNTSESETGPKYWRIVSRKSQKSLKKPEPSSPWRLHSRPLEISEIKGPWRWDCEELNNTTTESKSPQKQVAVIRNNDKNVDYQNVKVKQEIIYMEEDETCCQLGENGYVEERVGSPQSEPKIKREKLEDDEVIDNLVMIKCEIPEEVEVKMEDVNSSDAREEQFLGLIDQAEGIKEELTDDADSPTAEDKFFCMKYIRLNICRLCDCPVYTKLDKHIETHHKIGIFFHCPFCDGSQKFSKKVQTAELKKHQKLHSVNCQFCGETFRYWEEVTAHIDEKHQDEVSKCCSICDYKASSYHKLINHLLYLHKGETLIYYCEFCDFITFQPSLLQFHAEVKHQASPLKIELVEKNT